MNMVCTCVICNKMFKLQMTEDEYDKVITSADSIQNIFPRRDSFFCEALISRMCYDCQSRTFNRPKPGDDWGTQIGECECCGAPLWPKDAGVCPQCGTPMSAPDED